MAEARRGPSGPSPPTGRHHTASPSPEPPSDHGEPSPASAGTQKPKVPSLAEGFVLLAANRSTGYASATASQQAKLMSPPAVPLPRSKPRSSMRSATPPNRTASPSVRTMSPPNSARQVRPKSLNGPFPPSIYSSSGREPRPGAVPKKKAAAGAEPTPSPGGGGGGETHLEGRVPIPYHDSRGSSDPVQELLVAIAQSRQDITLALRRLPPTPDSDPMQQVVDIVTERHQHLMHIAQGLAVATPSARLSPISSAPWSSPGRPDPLKDAVSPAPSDASSTRDRYRSQSVPPREPAVRTPRATASPGGGDAQWAYVQQDVRRLGQQLRLLQDEKAIVMTQMHHQRELFATELAKAMRLLQTAQTSDLAQDLERKTEEVSELRTRLATAAPGLNVQEATLRQENAVLRKQLERLRAKHVEDLTRLKNQLSASPAHPKQGMSTDLLRSLPRQLQGLRHQLDALREQAVALPRVAAEAVAAAAHPDAPLHLTTARAQDPAAEDVVFEENKVLMEENAWLKEQLSSQRRGSGDEANAAAEVAFEGVVHDTTVKLVALTEWAIDLHTQTEAAIQDAQSDLMAMRTMIATPDIDAAEQNMSLKETFKQHQERRLTQLMQHSAALASGAARMSDISTLLTSDRAERIRRAATMLNAEVPTRRNAAVMREQLLALQQEHHQMLKRLKREVLDDLPLRAVWASTIQRLETEKAALEEENQDLRDRVFASVPSTTHL